MKTLFAMPKPDLIMVVEDVATSEDQLEAHLQRKGWELKRVKALQESISLKLTVDWITGKTEELSAAERNLQSDITEYLERKGQ